MQLNFQSTIEKAELAEMAEVLSEANVSDAQVASIMDIAGAVARERRVLVKKHDTRVTRLDGERFLLVNLVVGCSSREAADMVFELSGRIADLESIPKALHVSFVSE